MTAKEKKLAEELELDVGIADTFLYSVRNGYRTDYFPAEYWVLREGIKATKESIPAEWMDAWVKLWPTNAQIKKAGGTPPNVEGDEYSISGNKPECEKRMKTFLNQFCDRIGVDKKECTTGFKLDTIFKATETYLADLKKKDYRHAKKNLKFIMDQNGSGLETWCKKLLNSETQQTRRTYFV